MSQTHQLITTLKRLLKAKNVTYAQLALHLELSEASVKRQFSRQSINLRTLESICSFIGLELDELVLAASQAQSKLIQLTEAQEKYIVEDPKRVLVALCVLKHWTKDQIVSSYSLSESECIGYLLELDRLGMIRLMPENKVKLIIARGFSWLPGGPIHQFFRSYVQANFLESDFQSSNELIRFQQATLNEAETKRFQQRISRLLQEFADLHQEALSSPDNSERLTIGLLIAMRPWGPEIFDALKRQPA
ncbi:helix-turn-helix transcriptional regulator [Iodobacter sp. HSC-16F04]|uniref:Helix-turn-helix transcriptional regulator n=1 Tax=Iodobacter violaceini TaxID=3044271 RepID=A0ABX0KX83_9NEIS|nr:helix-turn-helix transcriptional regulator [Iodobacter violacea]NHQ88434.1 helix-turn-helix transcriptional regulator [Iodobacter violacea]